MTWALQKIEGIFPGIEDVSDPDFLAPWAVWEGNFWVSKEPEIVLFSATTNTNEIYIQEHPSATVNEKIRIMPWQTLKLSYSDIKAMNILYVTWTTWNVLFVLCR